MIKIPQITITRFIAALTVVVFHYGKGAVPFNIFPLNRVIPIGDIAVNYFFALSGFIMIIAYHAPNRQFINARKYWIARLARILPVYYLALIIVIPARFDPQTNNNIIGLLLNATFLQAWLSPYPMSFNYPGWSLSVEIFFYILFPFILKLFTTHSPKRITISVWLFWFLSQVLHIYLLNQAHTPSQKALHDLLFYNPLFHLNTFLLGIWTGIWFVNNHYNKKLSRANWLKPAGIIAFGIILLLLIIRDQIPEYINVQIKLTNGLLAPLFLLTIVAISVDRSNISKHFSKKAYVLLGDASYSIYILQFPVSGIYNNVIYPLQPTLSPTIHFYFYCLILIITSIIIYKFFEFPLRSYLKSLLSRRFALKTIQ